MLKVIVFWLKNLTSI